jgi:drug/metabolite transporter (DMT)-like permease
MSNIKSKGLALALIAAFISGVSIFINKFAVDAIKVPLVFTSVKNTGVALIVLGFLLASGKWKKVKKLGKKEAVLLLLIGIIGGSIPFYLFFTGLSMIPAVNGAIIQKTLVLWVGILAIPFLGERLSKTGWFAVILLFAANVLVGGFKGFSFSTGELYILAATIFWAVETIISKKVLPKVDADILVEARMGIGAMILLIMSAVLQPKALMGVLNLNATNWFWIILTMASLLAYLAVWYRGLKLAPATSATAVLVASTLVTNLLSAIFVTHSLNSLLVVQSVLIAAGVYAIYKVEGRAQNASKASLAQ